jgi:NADH:ubiquinone oxidoreductase subunit 4 (subunit M)
MSLPWLTVIGLLPTLGAPSSGRAAGCARARVALSRTIALGTSLLTLALTLVLAVRSTSRARASTSSRDARWIPQFGVSYAVGVDGIALGWCAVRRARAGLRARRLARDRRRGRRTSSPSCWCSRPS